MGKANWHCKKQYQELNKVYEFHKNIYSENLTNKTKSKITTDLNFMTADLISTNVRKIKNLMVFYFSSDLIIWKHFMINWSKSKISNLQRKN